MAKSRDAFRTISEVSEVLDTPAHVLRFWESKFNQIKPVKRAGGRRYYRPDDLALLASIKDQLHDKGLSIKEAQKLIRESGVKNVVAQGHVILSQDDATIEATMAPAPPPAPVVQLRAVEDTQSNLFSGAELPEQVAPRIEITGATAVPDSDPVIEEDEPTTVDWVASAVAEETPVIKATPIDLPPPPQPRDDVSARLLATLLQANPERARTNATQIAPLVARLTALRDEMRHPW